MVLPVLALMALGAPAHAAPPKARLAIVSKSERSIVDSKRVRVRVRFGQVGKVRLSARLARRGKPPLRLAVGKLVRFPKPGAKRVALRLTRPAARLLRKNLGACAGSRISIAARARRYRLRKGRLLLAPINRSHRSRTTRRAKRLGAACPKPDGASPPATTTPPATGGIRAGAASADITPPVGTPMFAYTARSGLANPPNALQIVADPDENLYAKSFVPSEGIHTRVRARAIVIEQRGKKFALVQADLGGLPYALTQEVLKRIEDTGVTAERLMLSATHTHSSTGPIWPTDSVGYALLGGDAFDPRIFELTAEGIAEAVRAANAKLEPAQIGVGTAQEGEAARNREFETFRRNPDVPADEAGARAASVDPTVTVVRVDSTGGRPLGVWSNFAIHPTSFGDDNLLFSGDNAATAERTVEREIGRGVVNVWTNGNEGDIAPNGGADQDSGDALQYVPNAAASANMAGIRTARGILAAWRDAGGRMQRDPLIDARRTISTFDGTSIDGEPVGPLPVLGFGGIVGPDGTCGASTPGQLPKQVLATGPLVPNAAPVSMWRIGSQGILALPTEMTKTQGKRIRDRLKADAGGRLANVALAGLTNAYLSYTATPEEYDACTYEGSFTLFGRQQGPHYREVARRVLSALLAGTQPASSPEPPPTGLGGDLPTVDQTPDAGTVVAEPALTVKRYERAVFRWKGGDPAADAPRGKAFVALQRNVGGAWQTVGTEDGAPDTTAFDDQAGEWTETWQFAECDPLGTYRFVVTGQADKGSGVEPYTVTSRAFELQRTAALTTVAPTVSAGKARLVARYPDPGADALLALPRRVRTGSARLRVNGAEVSAPLAADRLAFEAPAPAGATVEVVDVEDACGNSGP